MGRDRTDNWRFSKSNDLRKERLGAYIRKKPVIRLRKTLRPSWLIVSLFHLQESVQLFFKIVTLFCISTSLWQKIKKKFKHPLAGKDKQIVFYRNNKIVLIKVNDCWYLQIRRWISQTIYWLKDARQERLCTRWSHLHKSLKIQIKSSVIETDPWLSGDRSRAKKTHSGSFGVMKCSIFK